MAAAFDLFRYFGDDSSGKKNYRRQTEAYQNCWVHHRGEKFRFDFLAFFHEVCDGCQALAERAEELGLGGAAFLDKIADESNAITEEEVLEFITKNGHPVTALEPMF